MGDSKICSSCGYTIPAEAVFCPNCGGQQKEPDVQAKASVSTGATIDEMIAQETKNDANKPVKAEPPVQPAAPQQNANASPQMQKPQQSYQQQPVYQQPQPAYQQQQPGQHHPQQNYGPAQPAPAPAKPKKKFPWVFTIGWVIMLIFVGVWAFLWTTYPDNQKPQITTDTVRVISLVVSALLLIYTLNIKLATRKVKVVPTILLIISLLVSVFMFCSFELIEGDFLHDLVSPVTNAIFQIQ